MARSNLLRHSLPAVVGLATMWGGVSWTAVCAAGSPGEEARRILAALEADPTVRELVRHPVERAHAALALADSKDAAVKERSLYEAAALEWAGVARDTKRARDAEDAAARLEQALSSIQAELVRSRAAVEQALARVGRAQQELSERERDAKAPSSASSSIAPGASKTAPAAVPQPGTAAERAGTAAPVPGKGAPTKPASPPAAGESKATTTTPAPGGN